jgi:hypothetical protein
MVRLIDMSSSLSSLSAESPSPPVDPAIESPAGHEPKHPSRARFRKAVGIVGIALTGAIVAVAVPCVWDWWFGPKPDVLTNLMQDEVSAAEHPLDSAEILSRIYARNAVVVDAACGNSSAATVWHGETEIAKRYATLSHFDSLQHVNAEFKWNELDRWANRASATSETIGVTTAADPKADPKTKPRFIVGREQWTFEQTGATWFIKSFTYNLCLQ